MRVSSYRSLVAVLAVTVAMGIEALAPACAEDVRTHRDDRLGFELSYLPTWSPTSAPGNPAFMIRRNSPTEGATLSVNVAPQRGDVDAFLRERRKNPEGFVAGVRSRFPDAVLLHRGDTITGLRCAYSVDTI
jgi:hypothetical protein